ncbi:MAG TPA: methylated-DNA--[protein]-cysteine S-methyltransferase [Gammaproteobacteria bacterium]|nr:methylated-DNA--[protein]-cysteine S-methyltransferase [Gammaproteobacteria bacterium]
MGLEPRSGYQALVEAPFPEPHCLLGIRVADRSLIGIDYLFSQEKPLAPRTSLAALVVKQLQGYFADPGYRFHLPIQVRGTPFQRRVWAALREIPPGKTRTYGALAAALESSPRAVGNACRANPLPLVVPCHRVVSVSGLGGYDGRTAGRNISIKRWLLDHEAA